MVAIPAWLVLREFVPSDAPELCAALGSRRIVQLYAADGVAPRCPGVHVDGLDKLPPGVLESSDASALVSALRARKGSAIALLPERRDGVGVGAQLASYQHVAGLRGVSLSPRLAIYGPARELELSNRERDALGYVARALLGGAREPSVASFPAELRRVEPAEVMVTISRRGEPVLWRSSRATSIARALLMATRVARERWREREQALGGPLQERLPQLDVELSLLSEDGTLGNLQGAFVDRAISNEHGVGFDYRTAWHYLLPGAAERRKKTPFQALSTLITDKGFALSILGDGELRLYRFVPRSLGLSKAPVSAGGSP